MSNGHSTSLSSSSSSSSSSRSSESRILFLGQQPFFCNFLYSITGQEKIRRSENAPEIKYCSEISVIHGGSYFDYSSVLNSTGQCLPHTFQKYNAVVICIAELKQIPEWHRYLSPVQHHNQWMMVPTSEMAEEASSYGFATCVVPEFDHLSFFLKKRTPRKEAERIKDEFLNPKATDLADMRVRIHELPEMINCRPGQYLPPGLTGIIITYVLSGFDFHISPSIRADNSISPITIFPTSIPSVEWELPKYSGPKNGSLLMFYTQHYWDNAFLLHSNKKEKRGKLLADILQPAIDFLKNDFSYEARDRDDFHRTIQEYYTFLGEQEKTSGQTLEMPEVIRTAISKHSFFISRSTNVIGVPATPVSTTATTATTIISSSSSSSPSPAPAFRV